MSARLAALRSPAFVRFGVLGITGLASALWLFAITQRSLWADELGTTLALDQPTFAAMLAQTSEVEFRPPLYFILLRVWTLVGGDSEFALRYFSFFFAVLAVPLAYQVAQRIGGGRVGWLVALLMLLSPALALYGIMIRYYSLILFFGLALTVAFQRARDATQRSHFIAWALIALAAIYTDYILGALVLAQSAWLWWLWRRNARQVRLWLSAHLALALLYLPWAANMLRHALTTKVEADLATGPLSLALKVAYPFFDFTLGETIFPWHPLALIGVVAAGALLVLGARSFAGHAPWLPLAFAAPFALVIITFSTVAKDHPFVTLPARVLFLLPYVLIALALGATHSRLWLGALLLMALGVAQLAALVNLFNGAEYHNPIYAVPMRAVAATIARDAQRGDLVVADLDTSFSFYWRQQPANTTLVLEEDLPRVRDAIAAQPPHVWLLVFGRDRTQFQDHTDEIEGYLTSGYALRRDQGYVPIDPLYQDIKNRLVGRETYAYKLIVRLFERKP